MIRVRRRANIQKSTNMPIMTRTDKKYQKIADKIFGKKRNKNEAYEEVPKSEKEERLIYDETFKVK
jgi:hypothetical protein